MDYSREIAQNLLQIKAIQLSPQKPFIWASGIESPIYCDNRLLLSYPKVRSRVISAFKELANQVEFDTISGVATAGIAHGALLAESLGMPFNYIRSKAKGHGMQNLIEGRLEKGSKVLVIEDLISTGGSSLKAVDAINDYGAHVQAVFAIFTYGFSKSKEAFQKHNCPLFTITDFDIVMEEAVRTKYIKESEIEILQNWRAKFTK